MKFILFTFSLAVFAHIASAGTLDYREFTDEKGRTMRAKPITVVRDMVRIQRDDGREFNVSAQMFSKEDADYLYSWAIGHLAQKNHLFEIETKADKTKATKSLNGGQKVKNWEAFYEINIKNKSDLSLKNLNIEYRFYVFKAKVAAQRRGDGKDNIIAGRKTVKSLASKKETSFQSSFAKMSSTDLKGGWYYTEGGNDSSKDKLKGIWIRVYHKGSIIAEYISSPGISNKFNWSDGADQISQKKKK